MWPFIDGEGYVCPKCEEELTSLQSLLAEDEYIIDVDAGGADLETNLGGVGNSTTYRDYDDRRSNNEFFMALSNKGKVYTWGSNEYGQLGRGTWNEGY